MALTRETASGGRATLCPPRALICHTPVTEGAGPNERDGSCRLRGGGDGRSRRSGSCGGPDTIGGDQTIGQRLGSRLSDGNRGGRRYSRDRRDRDPEPVWSGSYRGPISWRGSSQGNTARAGPAASRHGSAHRLAERRPNNGFPFVR